ncbi:MAG TPA: response regulator transcription factor [Mucilaginibacter sp.]|nr:response regulator transcription factor [Mucilaginibacter sp.]
MKILIVEDDERIAILVRNGLEENGYTVMLAYDGEIGKKLVLQNDYDLIISDIILPKINGVDLCKQIRTIKPAVPIILLTALNTTDDIVEGFDAGADDYLTKPFDFRVLLARVRALLNRKERKNEPECIIMKYADLELNNHTKTVYRSGHEITLTRREFNLLAYLMSNNERVLSKTELAENVWHTIFDNTSNFIDVYINYLRKKIDKDHEVKLIHTRPGMGFIFKTGQ